MGKEEQDFSSAAVFKTLPKLARGEKVTTRELMRGVGVKIDDMMGQFYGWK